MPYKRTFALPIQGWSICLLLLLLFSAAPAAAEINFSQAIILLPQHTDALWDKTVQVLVEEVSRRSGYTPAVVRSRLLNDQLLLIVNRSGYTPKHVRAISDSMQQLSLPGKEGYLLKSFALPCSGIAIRAQDQRGMLYGIGRLLRKARIKPGVFTVPGFVAVSATPHYAIRGHQLGYRPKTNAYDAWGVKQFDQYIRELALFGANSIEIMPPRTDDDPTSRHFKLPAMDMVIEQSRLIHSYGLAVWVWYPNLTKDLESQETISRELGEREIFFRALPYLDAIFVPAGDPGDLHPDVLFPWLEKIAPLLHKYHPHATIWVSPQAKNPKQEWLDAFYRHANANVSWLNGIVFGPWTKTPLPELRKILRPDLAIRHYPDITHSLSCQYPVAMWDPAFALTLGRECCNPRPLALKNIHNRQAPYCTGSISYSEGINDDVNKFIWSDQDWDPTTLPLHTLRDYARLFISPDHYEEIAQAILALEKNWQGPLLINEQVSTSLQQWRDLESRVPRSVRANYRFQMGLLRSYYDAYIQRRLVYETELQNKAMDVLQRWSTDQPEFALTTAESLLTCARSHPVRSDLRQRCWVLADSLFTSIGYQLSVEKHGGMSGRGNFMDHIDEPLNDALWLLNRINAIQSEAESAKKTILIKELIHRTNPGPGGFYDKMGTLASFDRVWPQPDPIQDPDGYFTPQRHFEINLSDEQWQKKAIGNGFFGRPIPQAWLSQMGTLYGQPLRVRYEDLDPLSSYRLRVCYTGRFKAKIKCVTDEGLVVHDYLETGGQPIFEFAVPTAATRDGRIDLIFSCPDGERGLQVTEIWLLRNP